MDIMNEIKELEKEADTIDELKELVEQISLKIMELEFTNSEIRGRKYQIYDLVKTKKGHPQPKTESIITKEE